MRNVRQETWDRIALLEMIAQINRSGTVDGNLKLQKVAFLCELDGLGKGLRPLHFRFFRYNLGPYSKELANDVKFLESKGLVSTKSRELTKRARYILEYVAEAIERSREASANIEVIRSVAKQYAKYPGSKLTDIVYKLIVPVFDLGGEKLRVRDIEFFWDILDPTLTEGLTGPDTVDEQILNDIAEELAIPTEDLQPSSRKYQEVLAGVLDRLAKV